MSSTDRGRAARTASGIRTAAALGGLVFALAVGLAPAVSTAAPAARPGSPVFIGADGKLGGPMTGYAWVAAGPEASIAAPSPCNAQGCFRDRAASSACAGACRRSGARGRARPATPATGTRTGAR